VTDPCGGSRTGPRRTPGLLRTARLCSVAGADEAVLRRAGAVLSDGVWTVCADGECDLVALEAWLPRSLGGSAGGTDCGHVPRGHVSDLATSLCPSSWRVLSEVTCLRTGACVECGDEAKASCSPSWSWDDGGEVVQGLLLRVRSLCASCHHCARPDESSWRWPTAKRHARLAAVSGTDAASIALAVEGHARRFSSWQDREMTLDMSALSGLGLRFRKGWTHEEDLVRRDDASARIIGVVLSMSRGMVQIA
jgi:hypothetical protein